MSIHHTSQDNNSTMNHQQSAPVPKAFGSYGDSNQQSNIDPHSSNGPRVLIFIDWFLPGDKAGGPVRSLANILDHLEGKAQFYVITRNTDYCETKPYTTVATDTWVPYNSSAKVWYASKKYQSLNGFKKIIHSISFDLIYLNGIYSPKFSILPLFFRYIGIKKPVFIAPRGMLAPSAIDIKPLQKKLFLLFSRITGLHKARYYHATNEQERTYINKYLHIKKQVYIAPNLPRKLSAVTYTNPEKKPGSINIISIARIAPEKNTLFALEVLKEMKISMNLTFTLYGSVYNQDYFEQCRAITQQLPDFIQVDFKGPLEANRVPEKLALADLLFMPTRGENFGHVILESMTVGTPVLISDKTPWKNLDQKQCGWDLPLSDKQQFIQILSQVSGWSQDQYNAFRKSTLEYARQYLKTNDATKMTLEMFNNISKH